MTHQYLGEFHPVNWNSLQGRTFTLFWCPFLSPTQISGKILLSLGLIISTSYSHIERYKSLSGIFISARLFKVDRGIRFYKDLHQKDISYYLWLSSQWVWMVLGKCLFLFSFFFFFVIFFFLFFVYVLVPLRHLTYFFVRKTETKEQSNNIPARRWVTVKIPGMWGRVTHAWLHLVHSLQGFPKLQEPQWRSSWVFLFFNFKAK